MSDIICTKFYFKKSILVDTNIVKGYFDLLLVEIIN